MSRELLNKAYDEIRDKNDECKKLENELNEIKKSLASKTSDYSDLVKQNKKIRNELDIYIKTFGVIGCEDSDDTENVDEANNISFESKIEYLKLFKILVCGGSEGICDILIEKTGLDILQATRENSVAIDSNFDICVILTTLCSHSTLYKAADKAANTGAELIYFEGTNYKKFVDLLYKRMFSVYGEA